MRKFVVTPSDGKFGPTFIEVDDDSYVVFVDDDDLPAEMKKPYFFSPAGGLRTNPWTTFMEDAPDNTRVMIADVKELWSE